MKIAKTMMVAALLSLASTAVHAQRDWSWDTRERFSYNPEGDKYLAQEFSIDVFGSYKRGAANVTDVFDEPEHGIFGGGLGVNYFFTKMLGVGADVSMHDNGRQFVDNVAANLIARFPIGDTAFAPYVLGGAGYEFDPTGDWEGHAGIGVEFRMNPRTGVFADARYIWPNSSGDSSLIRTGLRFAF